MKYSEFRVRVINSCKSYIFTNEAYTFETTSRYLYHQNCVTAFQKILSNYSNCEIGNHFIVRLVVMPTKTHAPFEWYNGEIRIQSKTDLRHCLSLLKKIQWSRPDLKFGMTYFEAHFTHKYRRKKSHVWKCTWKENYWSFWGEKCSV